MSEAGRTGKWWWVTAAPRSDITATDRVWTLSRDPSREGWRTDGGTPGYGLSYAEAAELADAANARLAKLEGS